LESHLFLRRLAWGLALDRIFLINAGSQLSLTLQVGEYQEGRIFYQLWHEYTGANLIDKHLKCLNQEEK
jgi:hypothetical protein